MSTYIPLDSNQDKKEPTLFYREDAPIAALIEDASNRCYIVRGLAAAMASVYGSRAIDANDVVAFGNAIHLLMSDAVELLTAANHPKRGGSA